MKPGVVARHGALLLTTALLCACSVKNEAKQTSHTWTRQVIGSSLDGGGIVRATVQMAFLTGIISNRLGDIALTDDPGTPTDFGEIATDAPVSAWSVVDPWIPRTQRPRRTARFGRYEARTWHQGSGTGFALLKDGKPWLGEDGNLFLLTSATCSTDDGGGLVPGPDPGEDIDGDGVPDLLVYGYSGGAHCCFTTLHFSCGETPVLRCRINTWHSTARYEDLDGDGRCEVKLGDSSYAYWNACFAGSPEPTVILSIHDGRYDLALDLMRLQGPRNKDLPMLTQHWKDELAVFLAFTDRLDRGEQIPDDDPVWSRIPLQAWRNEERNVAIPSDIWGVMLDLIYSDRTDEAFAFARAVWPAGRPGERAFESDLSAAILASWYGARLPWADRVRRHL